MLGAASLLALAGCSGGKEAGGPPPGVGAPAPVHAAAAETRRVPVELMSFGTAEPLSTIEMKAQVSGEIIEVLFTEGDRVTQGQPLFRIDPRPFEAALAEAEANVARAEAQRGLAEANLRENEVKTKYADVALERNKTLLEREFVTQEEFDQTKTAADALKASASAVAAAVRSASEDIRAAQATVEVAKLNLSYCEIVSPMDGRTGSLMAHRGNLVTANAADPLVVITQTKPMYVSFTLPERYLSELRPAMERGNVPVYATIPESTLEPMVGKLTFIDNAVDKVTSTIRLKAVFENETENLWPGQYINIRLGLGFLDNQTTVPAQAVQTSQDGTYVYVIDAESKAEIRAVKPGIAHGDVIVIEEGVQPGEQVITEGHLRVAPGMSVRLLSDDPAPEANAG
jgi:multidrug efflux system membrane fusion protein